MPISASFWWPPRLPPWRSGRSLQGALYVSGLFDRAAQPRCQPATSTFARSIMAVGTEKTGRNQGATKLFVPLAYLQWQADVIDGGHDVETPIRPALVFRRLHCGSHAARRCRKIFSTTTMTTNAPVTNASAPTAISTGVPPCKASKRDPPRWFPCFDADRPISHPLEGEA